ncbi:MAG: AraC family transcriptional regulator, partial [Chloroflexi bacterium]|nr:AraC family transcriptional regulator [Chloroflexota bacterium]
DAVDVTAGGELVLRLADGTRRAFAAGDVHGAAGTPSPDPGPPPGPGQGTGTAPG